MAGISRALKWNLIEQFILVRPLEFRSTSSGLFSLKLMFECSKSESLRDVSVTRVGDTISYGYP